MKTLKITGISQDEVKFGTKITIESGKEKYSFFDKKRDGNFTKAFEQFKKYKFAVGDEVSCEVKEEEKSFQGDKGMVNYTQRTILYFQEVEGVPTHTPSKEVKAPVMADLAPLFDILADHTEMLKRIDRNTNKNTDLPF